MVVVLLVLVVDYVVVSVLLEVVVVVFGAVWNSRKRKDSILVLEQWFYVVWEYLLGDWENLSIVVTAGAEVTLKSYVGTDWRGRSNLSSQECVFLDW